MNFDHKGINTRSYYLTNGSIVSLMLVNICPEETGKDDIGDISIEI
jgi:hypothetical protein